MRAVAAAQMMAVQHIPPLVELAAVELVELVVV